VKFIYQELPEDGRLSPRSIEGNEVVYSVVLTKARNPLSREDVESHFKGPSFQRSSTTHFGTLPAQQPDSNGDATRH